MITHKPEKNVLTVVFAVQILILAFVLIQQLKPRDDIIFSYDNFTLHRNGGNTESAFYVDSSYDGTQKRLLSDSFILDRGVYNVTIDYQTNHAKGTGVIGCWSQVVAPEVTDRSLESGKSRLLYDIPQMNYHVYVHDDNVPAQVENGIDDALEVYLLIEEITIRYCNVQSALHDGIIILLIFSVMDILLYLFLYQKENTCEFLKEHALALSIMAIALLLANAPLMREGIGDGLDLRFHQHRIYEIANSIKAGCFPVYIMPDWMNGYGYACGIFYGDTFLYLPALLYLSGFSLSSSYKFFIIHMNIITAAVAYVSFKKIGGTSLQELLRVPCMFWRSLD